MNSIQVIVECVTLIGYGQKRQTTTPWDKNKQQSTQRRLQESVGIIVPMHLASKKSAMSFGIKLPTIVNVKLIVSVWSLHSMIPKLMLGIRISFQETILFLIFVRVPQVKQGLVA
tara:strand:- start:47734 stop:48078 length:345 start_codon:yes stop_codon:yes gene_type:complete